MRPLLISLFFAISSTAIGQQSAGVRLLHHWNDTQNVRLNRINQRYNDVWGFVQHGREYAVIGSTEGAHIIDVVSGQQAAFAPGAARGAEIIHRDYKTFGHYLYAVCDEGISNLQVFDLSFLPDSIHLVYESDPLELALCHNIFIDTAKGKLYAASVKGLASGSDHMRVYSLKHPEQPTLLTKYNRNSKVHDVFVRNDTAFCSAEFYGLEIVDFSGPPGTWQNIGELTAYPYKGYNHSSWVRQDGVGVMADETHGLPLKIINVNNLEEVRVLSHFAPRTDSTCIPHNPYIVGNYVFVSWYFDGLQIYDISDPANPRRAGFFDTYSSPSFVGFAGAWGCYPFLPSGKVLLSDMQSGLHIFDVSGAAPGLTQSQSAALFPNPTTGSFYWVVNEEWIGAIQMHITDGYGRRLWEQTLHITPTDAHTIQLLLPEPWSPGVYFFQATCSAGMFQTKMIKR